MNIYTVLAFIALLVVYLRIMWFVGIPRHLQFWVALLVTAVTYPLIETTIRMVAIALLALVLGPLGMVVLVVAILGLLSWLSIRLWPWLRSLRRGELVDPWF